jgi:hypothetical protein
VQPLVSHLLPCLERSYLDCLHCSAASLAATAGATAAAQPQSLPPLQCSPSGCHSYSAAPLDGTAAAQPPRYPQLQHSVIGCLHCSAAPSAAFTAVQPPGCLTFSAVPPAATLIVQPHASCLRLVGLLMQGRLLALSPDPAPPNANGPAKSRTARGPLLPPSRRPSSEPNPAVAPAPASCLRSHAAQTKTLPPLQCSLSGCHRCSAAPSVSTAPKLQRSVIGCHSCGAAPSAAFTAVQSPGTHAAQPPQLPPLQRSPLVCFCHSAASSAATRRSSLVPIQVSRPCREEHTSLVTLLLYCSQAVTHHKLLVHHVAARAPCPRITCHSARCRALLGRSLSLWLTHQEM